MNDQRKIPDLNFSSCMDLSDPMIGIRRAITYQLPKKTIFDQLSLKGANFTYDGLLWYPPNNQNDTQNWNNTDEKLPVRLRYWEGPINFSLFMMLGLVLCIIVVCFVMLYIRAIGIKYPCPIMIVYKMAMLALALLIFLLSLLVLVGQFFTITCSVEITHEVLLEIRRDFYNLAVELKNLTYRLYKYVDTCNKKYQFILLHERGYILDVIPQGFFTTTTTTGNPYETTTTTRSVTTWATSPPPQRDLRIVLYEMEKLEAPDPMWTEIASLVKKSIYIITTHMKDYARDTRNFMVGQVLGPLNALAKSTKLMMQILMKMLRGIRPILEYLRMFIGASMIFTGLSISTAVCMVATIRTRDPKLMKRLCKLAYVMMILWWLVAMFYVPLVIYLADMCDRPVDTFLDTVEAYFDGYRSNNTNTTIPFTTRELVRHYITCDGANPMAKVVGPYLQALGFTVKNVLRMVSDMTTKGEQYEALGDVVEAHDVSEKLNTFKSKLYLYVIIGCDKGFKLFDGTVKLACNQCLLGMLIIGVTAPFLGLLHMVYVILCLRIKNFVAGKPPKETKLQRMKRHQKERIMKMLRLKRQKELKRAKVLKETIARDEAEAKKIALAARKKEQDEIETKEYNRVKAMQNQKLRSMTEREDKTHWKLKAKLRNLPICMCKAGSEEQDKQDALKDKARYVLKVKCPEECKEIRVTDLEMLHNANKLHAMKSKAEQQRELEVELAEDLKKPPCPPKCKGRRIRSPCLGLDRLRTFRRVGIKLAGERGTQIQKMKMDDITDAQGCPAVECPMTIEALTKLEEADQLALREPDREEHKSVRLSCGCRFPTYQLRRFWGDTSS